MSEAFLLQIEQDYGLKNKGERSVLIWEKWGQFGQFFFRRMYFLKIGKVA
jgi:hypothetical protein